MKRNSRKKDDCSAEKTLSHSTFNDLGVPLGSIDLKLTEKRGHKER